MTAATATKVADCVIHKDGFLRKHWKYVVPLVLFVIGFVFLMIWLFATPTKPTFTLQDVTLLAFNISSLSTTTQLMSKLQITISSRNPNQRCGIYYDNLDVYATYRTQEITHQTAIPPSFQEHEDVTTWSPLLIGLDAPLAPFLVNPLGEDQAAGTVPINIRASGRVRYKIGGWVSFRHFLNVNCPAFIKFQNNAGGYSVTPAVLKYQLDGECTVDD
ncbi:Late embryogenesis abundant protein, LEA-14 [Artemisia annua]|uniref:Late embryogenesis abundant protein, LEA-14 n=1 Tax=Artemisia annua TaxID=35608 RepID=A0A2U1MQ12_ARTAN|nr:Late embryogenesis abundant protein, LEA-14 [Artemisia annua]